jgi:uncharacterized tellurite resistance protein B-like protein
MFAPAPAFGTSHSFSMIFDRLLSYLQALPERASGATRPEDDPRIAAAALLVHVMEADGSRNAKETRQLRRALSEAYGITGRELEAVVSAGETADHEAVDLYAFTNTLKRNLDSEGRSGFIRMMWEMVYADGQRHELEDNIVWRVAELIGVESRERVLLRQQVLGSLGGDA